MTGPRDWDKEMAEIDKIIASGKAPPQAASGPALPARAGQAKPSAPATQGPAPVQTLGRHKVGIWLRTLIGIGGVLTLQFWPYGNGCGTMLYLYMLSALAVTLIGAWAMQGAWTHRRGYAHIGGLLVFVAGLSSLAIQILERTGYAAVRLGWTCP